MEYVVTTGPATEPVTSTEAKLWCRQDGSADDNVFTDLIAGARTAVERYTGRALITQTVRVLWNADETAGGVYIPLPPWITTTSVKTYDVDRVATVLVSGTDFDIVGTDPAILYGSIAGSGRRSLEWIGTAGYGAASAVPKDIKDAVLQTIAYWYEDRERSGLPEGAKRLLAPYRANLVGA